jgi:hypothetical protein
MAQYPSNTAGDADLYVAVDNLSSNLSAAIDDSVTTIPLASAAGFPAVGIVTIESEKIRYTGVSGNSLTGATRGFSSTSAAAHASGTFVGFFIVEEHHNSLKDEVVAVQTDLRSAITADLDDAVAPAATASNIKQRLDHIVTQLLRITGEADWKTNPANKLKGFANGSAAAPSITFGADPDTGWFGASNNTMYFSSGGVQKGYFTGDWIAWSDGSAAFPAYSFMNDIDTGIYRSGANELSMAAGGGLAATFFPAGCIFLASGAEIANVRAAGFRVIDGTAALPSLSFLNDTNTGIYRHAADYLAFSTGGAQRFRCENTICVFSTPAQIQSGLGLYLTGNDAAAQHTHMRLSSWDAVGGNDRAWRVLTGWSGDTEWGAYSLRIGPYNTGSSGHFVVGAPMIRFGTGQPFTKDAATDFSEYFRANINQCLFQDGTAALPGISFRDDPDTGFYRQGSGITAYSSDGFRTLVFGKATASDDVKHELIDMRGGGNSCATFLQNYTTTGITTTAKRIGAPGSNCVLVLVAGNDGTNYFRDLVFTGYTNTTPTVISSTTEQGTPAARTYTHPNVGELFLAMASGTYRTQVFQISVSSR